MKTLTFNQYRRAEKDFRIAFGICGPLLTTDANNDIEHYLDHGELEMAYESLGLSLQAEKIDVPNLAKEILYPLGSVLGLDKESVLNVNFWEHVSPLLRPMT